MSIRAFAASATIRKRSRSTSPVGGILTPQLHKLLKRRAAIEPVIGHTKHDHGMHRNYLLGQLGDSINAMLSACAWNLNKSLAPFCRTSAAGACSLTFSGTTTSRQNWIVGIDAAHDNPYDGATLKPALAQVKRVTGVRPQEAFVDKGFRGQRHHPKAVAVYISGRRNLTPQLP